MKFRILLLTHFITVLLNAQQTDSVSLASFINQALSANYKLKASRSSVQATKARVDQATMWEAPQVAVSMMDNPLTSLNPLNGLEREYSITQMIPFPGKNASAQNAAQANVAFAEDLYSAEERVIIAEVKKQYAMIYSAQRRIDVNLANQDLLKQMIASVRSKYSVGLASQADILRLEIELSKLENQRANLEHDLRVPEAMLNTLRALPTTTPVAKLPEITLSSFSLNKDDLAVWAVAQRRELSAMKNEVEMSKAELAMAQRERFPDLMIGGLYKEKTGMPDTWEVMLGISIPIAPWVSGKIGGRIEENEYKLQRSEALVSDMETMVRFEVIDTWTKAKAHWEQAERYRTSIIPNAQQTLESLLSAYQTGKTDFLSLIDSFRMLQMYKMEYYMEISDYLMHRYDLERAIGADFETNF
ncbi:MAG: TolC family protein [Ignavibacteriales bacterium]|nr:TolC family protein [Ignavibacteriales bacterium]